MMHAYVLLVKRASEKHMNAHARVARRELLRGKFLLDSPSYAQWTETLHDENYTHNVAKTGSNDFIQKTTCLYHIPSNTIYKVETDCLFLEKPPLGK